MIRTYIGIGSNLGNPLGQVSSALAELARIRRTRLEAHSPWYQTRAVGPRQPDFINGVARLDTALAPEALLDALQRIEQAHQRVRRLRWGPRTLDLDILLYGDDVIGTGRLTIPHPQLTRRAFVLYPLADLAPDLTLPDGVAIGSLLANRSPEGVTRLA